MSEAPKNQALVVPASGNLPELRLELSNILEAEQRYPEVKTVNPITYVDLEHSFNEAYRDIKRHIAKIDDQLNKADKALEEAKADIILDKYPEFMKDKPKSHDNADLRKAFLARDPSYAQALDKVNQLKALASHFDVKLKVVENVARYMRQQIRLVEKSGLANIDLYCTIKNK